MYFHLINNIKILNSDTFSLYDRIVISHLLYFYDTLYLDLKYSRDSSWFN